MVRILIEKQEVKQSHYVLRIFPKMFCFPDLLFRDLNLFIYIFSHIYIINGIVLGLRFSIGLYVEEDAGMYPLLF